MVQKDKIDDLLSTLSQNKQTKEPILIRLLNLRKSLCHVNFPQYNSPAYDCKHKLNKQNLKFGLDKDYIFIPTTLLYADRISKCNYVALYRIKNAYMAFGEDAKTIDSHHKEEGYKKSNGYSLPFTFSSFLSYNTTELLLQQIVWNYARNTSFNLGESSQIVLRNLWGENLSIFKLK